MDHWPTTYVFYVLQSLSIQVSRGAVRALLQVGKMLGIV
jgi:hypothetical protein